MSLRRRSEAVRSLAGWPLRRALNPRVEWTVAEIDARLGSGQNARPPVHERLDQIEGAVAGVAARLDQIAARLEALDGTVAAGARDAALERGATEESFAAVLEALRQVDARLAEIELSQAEASAGADRVTE